MEDFAEEAALLEDVGAGIRIANAQELSDGVLQLLSDPPDLQRRGESGQRVVRANMGAAERYAKLVISCIDKQTED
jgi:3-deoxy-D-manno-octulosonic-acid transferase